LPAPHLTGRGSERGGSWGLKYQSQRLWTKKRLAWARQMVIERLEGPTDFEWVRVHPHYLPRKPRWMKQARYRKLRRKLEHDDFRLDSLSF
jgi:hypothetical protein